MTTILTAESEAEYSSTRYKLHKLLTWLQEHCFEEHNWQQLAEQFHLTTRTAFRHIKEATGLTPDNYLKRLRLVSARSNYVKRRCPLPKWLICAASPTATTLPLCIKKCLA